MSPNRSTHDPFAFPTPLLLRVPFSPPVVKKTSLSLFIPTNVLLPIPPTEVPIGIPLKCKLERPPSVQYLHSLNRDRYRTAVAQNVSRSPVISIRLRIDRLEPKRKEVNTYAPLENAYAAIQIS
jgi:hypothetical protein